MSSDTESDGHAGWSLRRPRVRACSSVQDFFTFAYLSRPLLIVNFVICCVVNWCFLSYWLFMLPFVIFCLRFALLSSDSDRACTLAGSQANLSHLFDIGTIPDLPKIY